MNMEKYFELFEDVLHKRATLDEAADIAGMERPVMRRCVTLYGQVRATEGTSPITLERYPVLAEKLKELLPTMPTVMKRARTTAEMRDRIIEAIQAGGTHAAIAERFDVTKSTVQNIVNRHRKNQREAAPPPPPPVLTEKVASDLDVGVTIEGDYIVIKMLKTKVTRALLSAVL